jgi:hypothetical protein
MPQYSGLSFILMKVASQWADYRDVINHYGVPGIEPEPVFPEENASLSLLSLRFLHKP